MDQGQAMAMAMGLGDVLVLAPPAKVQRPTR